MGVGDEGSERERKSLRDTDGEQVEGITTAEAAEAEISKPIEPRMIFSGAAPKQI